MFNSSHIIMMVILRPSTLGMDLWRSNIAILVILMALVMCYLFRWLVLMSGTSYLIFFLLLNFLSMNFTLPSFIGKRVILADEACLSPRPKHTHTHKRREKEKKRRRRRTVTQHLSWFFILPIIVVNFLSASSYSLSGDLIFYYRVP